MNNLVSIVTRTQNRTILLRRLKNNLLKQTRCDFCWIIVNDGGDNHKEIDKIASEAQEQGLYVVVKHFSVSSGRSKAANVGIRASCSKYVMLLDDDDTLSEECLEREVNFLESNAQSFAGVICYVNKIREQIESEKIIEYSSGEIFANDTDALTIGKVFSCNPIMTCGFLYQRQIWESIGGYPEHINYTEDWYFNVQFLLLANIGLIPLTLANVHNRVEKTGGYSNTTSTPEKIVEHELTALAWKNDLLRKLAKDQNELLVVLSASINNHDINLIKLQQISINFQVHLVLDVVRKILKVTGINFLISSFRKLKKLCRRNNFSG